MDWDEGPDIGGSYEPYRQSQRIDIYRKYAEKLIGEGKAYYCFCSPEKLAEKRNKAIAEKNYYEYDRECLRLTADEIKENKIKCKKHTIRLFVPENKTVSFDDQVYGLIKVDSKIIEDFIILRSNGLPTYNFSVAIDDILMEITHVIRGEDHLSNTPKQLLIYDALGVIPPVFTHLPMILGQDGQKLSKRHGSISIEAYREEGFLPEAILNYLALLGWAYDEKTTIFSKEELVNKFGLDSINKKPAKFDYEKLLWLNGTYIIKSA
jgi:glutamyl-tRNA synthetase